MHSEAYSNVSEGTNIGFCCVSSSVTEEPPQEDFGPQYHRTARICILFSMIAFSLLGNSMICWQLLPFRRKRFPKSKVLFLNLAAADLCVTFFAMSSQTVWEIMGKVWLAGDAFCKIVKFLQTYSLTLSTYILVAIALDRYNAIVKPFSRTPAPKSYAIAAWITSLLPSVPCYFIFQEVLVSSNVSYCVSIFYTSQYPHYWRQLYMAYIFLSIFIIPSLLLLGLYTRILVEIWTQSSVFSSNELSTSSLPRAKTKTLKMTIAIFLTFIITNLPYVIQEMILAFGDSKLLDPNIVALFGVISASNSAFNPYIYLTFQSKPTCFGKML
ncbi:cardioacceleratory peptide receptor-like [Uloborus diversus]|uniref:cardioacceleratory peptide receptor-like n=1 Tax=Uloborus diversus TaxID=327109 RepID=UPI00240A98FF|nr:cardioacceleratory peptide receptor-like [Uloborus diversus]